MFKLCIRYSTAIICCALFLTHNLTYGQTVSDTLQFDEIEVVATRIYQPLNYQPTNVEVIDSVQLEMLKTLSVAEVLASQSSLVIKDYGPGGMATASQRGLSSEQIQVLWEGIPINSPMQGQVDLSLLPASFFSDVQVSSGTPSTAFGGGSLSGALYLGSNWRQKNYVTMHQGIGSFGQWQSSLQGKYSSNDAYVSLRGLYDYGENDYEYFSRAYNKVERREHNRSKRYSVMTSVGQNMNGDRWKTTFWLSDSRNQIPGDILSTNPEAQQNDSSLRWLSSYQKNWDETKVSFKNYLENLELNYFDPSIGTRSLSTTKRWMVSINATHSLNKHIFLKGEVSGELTNVETNNYKDKKVRQQISALTNPEIQLLDKRFRIYPALRLDMYSDFGSVFSPSIGANYELYDNRIFIRGQLSRDFNPPSFNALYWGEVGDPNLKPERSNSAELGFSLSESSVLGTVASLDVTGYYSKVDNGIRWYPDDAGQWAPSNVEQLTTKGIESHLVNTFLIGDRWFLKVDQKAIFTNTKLSEARFPGDQGVGNQVRLVPKWKYNASLSIQRGIATVIAKYRWISRRYLTETEDRNNSLAPYQVVDVHLQLEKKLQNFTLKVQAAVKNLFDEDYEIISWYPMPKRNYNFSITATYKF